MSPILTAKRDLRSSADLSREDIERILELARGYRGDLRNGLHTDLLKGKSLALVFEKPSLRTRATFELGMWQLGGKAVYFSPAEINIGKRESVEDVARNLERWFDFVMARTFSQSTVDGLCRHCRVPVINGLSDTDHPCQALADFMALEEKIGELEGARLTYVGDGNNVCNALMLVGVKLGMHITVSSPAGFEPKPAVVAQAEDAAADSGGSFTFVRSAREAVKNAQAIYTDVWASMGQENEAGAREHAFQDWQVNAALMACAPDGAYFMHDLPAHRGQEVTDEVMDGETSIVFDQAEHRLHAQKGVLAWMHETAQA